MIVFSIKINVPETLFTPRFAPRNFEKKTILVLEMHVNQT